MTSKQQLINQKLTLFWFKTCFSHKILPKELSTLIINFAYESFKTQFSSIHKSDYISLFNNNLLACTGREQDGVMVRCKDFFPLYEVSCISFTWINKDEETGGNAVGVQ